MAGERTAAAGPRDAENTLRALAKSESLLAQAQQIADIGSWEWDVRTDVVTWSDQLYRIYGLEPRSFAASFAAFVESVHPDDRERVVATIQQASANCEAVRFEHRAVRPDGEVRELHCRAECEADESGELARMFGIAQDVTERNRGERALRDAEALFRGAFERAPIGMALTRPDGAFERVNGSLCRMLGYREDELVGLRFRDITHPDDLGVDLAALRAMLAGERDTHQVEKRYIHADGHAVWVSLSVALVRDVDGAPLYFVSQMEDITERRAAAEQLASRKEFQEALLGSLREGVLACDADGVLTYVNRAAIEILGEGRRALPGPLQRALDGDEVRSAELVVAEHDGSRRTLLVNGQAFEDRAGNKLGAVVAMHDITERKHMEHALREAEERFRKVFEASPVGIVLVAGDFRIIQANAAFCSLTGYDEEELLDKTFADLTHPDDVALDAGLADAVFSGRIPSYQVEKRYLTKDGDVIWAAVTAAVVREENDTPLYGIGIVENVTERKRFEGQLQYFADHDPLTGLFNRRRFEQELGRRVAYAARYRPGGAVLLLDLDNFKYVNDTLGHRVGDELIAGVADVMRTRLRGSDVLARLGGDEFAVVLPEVNAAEAGQAADGLRAAIADYAMTVDGRTVRTTASIGVTLIDERAVPAEQLIVESDLAMYAAKHAGRDRTTFYEPGGDDHSLIRTSFTWSARLREALEQDRFVLHAQPIVDVETGATTRYELLIRMIDHDGSLVPPATFLSTAERFGFIEAIDRWVVGQAIDILAARPDLTLEVNLSGKSIGSAPLLEAIESRLRETGADPHRLIFEVTETAAITNMEAAREFARSLKGLGCKFALDDFGAGFGSFVYLKHLPVDYLKLDGDFIRRLPDSPTDQLVVRAMVDVARGLGQRTIAEFVGSEKCFELLRDLGVDLAQGFWLGAPGPLPEPAALPA